MSIHKSLKVKSVGQRFRSVLSRLERLTQLEDESKWEEGDSIYGLPKVKVQKARKIKKVKEEVEGEEGAEAPAAAPPAEDS